MCGQVARKQALASLAQIVEFRRYAMALLAEAVGHMDPVEPFMALDQITNDKVQQQLTCLVAFIQGADWTESHILEGQYIKAAVALKQDFELLKQEYAK